MIHSQAFAIAYLNAETEKLVNQRVQPNFKQLKIVQHSKFLERYVTEYEYILDFSSFVGRNSTRENRCKMQACQGINSKHIVHSLQSCAILGQSAHIIIVFVQKEHSGTKSTHLLLDRVSRCAP